MSSILALDLGTTGNRCIAFSSKGAILAESYLEFPQHYPQTAWVEHDALDIWESCRSSLNHVLEQVAPSTILGVGITNQRETTVIWDRHTGVPIHNAIVWQCRRTANRCQELKDHQETVRNKTGLPLDPYFSATKIEWLLDNVEGARERAMNGDLCFGTIDTWILWKLTNGAVHATDASNASRTMLYNIHDSKWDSALCTLFNVPESLLPEVYDSNHLFGKTSSDHTGVEFPILAILGDQQAALFAQCGSDSSRLKNTYGTGLFLMSYVGETIPNAPSLCATVAWSQNGVPHYALEGSVFVGGASVQFLRDQLGLITDANETDALARSISHNEGVYFVPALTGLGAPYWDSQARGLLIGLTRGTNKAHIVRAALESMAYQTKDVLMAMEDAFTNFSFKSLRVDGGASKNNFLMQFQADLIGIPVEKATLSESTAFGVAGMAGIHAGLWTELEFRALVQAAETYTPSGSTLLETDYAKWQDAVSRARSWA